MHVCVLVRRIMANTTELMFTFEPTVLWALLLKCESESDALINPVFSLHTIYDAFVVTESSTLFQNVSSFLPISLLLYTLSRHSTHTLTHTRQHQQPPLMQHFVRTQSIHNHGCYSCHFKSLFLTRLNYVCIFHIYSHAHCSYCAYVFVRKLSEAIIFSFTWKF